MTGAALAFTFQSPRMLWLLLLVPLAVVAYILAQRRRTEYAVRFTNLDLLASVVTRSPRWRRHVPPIAYLLALSTLLVALGRPTTKVRESEQQATVMLVVDVSGSMIATDVQPTRIAAAQRAAHTFVDELPAKLRVGVVAFSSEARLLAPPSTDRSLTGAAIDSLTALGATAMGDAIELAVAAAEQPPPGSRPASKPTPAVLLLLSDGKNTVGRDPITAADDAASASIKVFTVALGTPDGVASIPDSNGVVQDIPVPPDPETLQAVAEHTGGKFFTAPSAEELSSVYGNLGSRLGQVSKTREITAWFAGGAVVLLLIGAGLALAWFSKFP